MMQRGGAVGAGTPTPDRSPSSSSVAGTPESPRERRNLNMDSPWRPRTINAFFSSLQDAQQAMDEATSQQRTIASRREVPEAAAAATPSRAAAAIPSRRGNDETPSASTSSQRYARTPSTLSTGRTSTSTSTITAVAAGPQAGANSDSDSEVEDDEIDKHYMHSHTNESLNMEHVMQDILEENDDSDCDSDDDADDLAHLDDMYKERQRAKMLVLLKKEETTEPADEDDPEGSFLLRRGVPSDIRLATVPDDWKCPKQDTVRGEPDFGTIYCEHPNYRNPQRRV